MIAGVLSVAGVIVLAGVLTKAQQSAPMAGHDMPMPKGAAMPQGMAMMTTAQKIANAMEAGPASVTGKATVLDWPAKEGAAPMVLRKGTNGWSCFPDMPETKGNDPMCVDAMWMKWVEAYLAHTPPMITGVGIGYMMASGGAWGSNTDPYAMAETKDNQWGHHMPHVMILVPDVKSLAGMTKDPASGGPYVMFAGTPYAHIMAPTADTMMPMGK
jgi:hypothetical protein